MADAHSRAIATPAALQAGARNQAPRQNATSPQELQTSSSRDVSVIFLDIDGVLNRGSKDGEHSVDSDLLARFDRLLRATSARTVLASTWRHDPAALADARRLSIPFEDVLPDLRPQPRGTEVKDWLASHPEADRFAILDDEADGYDKLPLFQPRPSKGLTPKIAAGLGHISAVNGDTI